MEPDTQCANGRIVPVDQAAGFWDDRDAVRSGLVEDTPRVPGWFGYDERGSWLFESITELPTYYPTRVERQLLERYADEIAEAIDGDSLAELGSGSAKKTRLLMSACLRRRPIRYLPIDVSKEMLETSISSLGEELPALTVRGLWGRYEAGLAWLRENRSGRRVLALLGSNLGNSPPAERDGLLADIAATARTGDQFLVSVDLHKSTETLETAYNDPPGRDAFAEFRLNHLTHLNRRFGGDFEPADFHPRAHYDEDTTTVEGLLHATKPQRATLPGLGLTVELAAGEAVNVGYSKKFVRPTFLAQLAGHGFTLEAEWRDHDWQYTLLLLRRE